MTFSTSSNEPSPIVEDGRKRRSRRKKVPPTAQIVLIIAATLIMVVAVIAGALTNASLQASNQSLRDTNRDVLKETSALAENNDALRTQVLKLGLAPVAPPAKDVIGTPGAAGAAGRDGISVSAVNCNADGSWTVRYSDGTSQTDVGPCIGNTGSPGQAIVGPPGANGINGKNGVDGAPGATGASGQPPVSWTFTWLNTTYTCSRVNPFDPSNPQYTCPADQGVTP